jgi:hypothetical protein
MKAIHSTTKLSLELKYCERCGGLWLRPAGGRQIYCAACGKAMAELPPAACDAGDTASARGSRRRVNVGDLEARDEARGVDAAGGLS